MASLASADVIKWDAPEQDIVKGYKVYYNDNSKTVGFTLEYDIEELNLTPGVLYKMYVTCYDIAGNESEPSNVVDYTLPAIVPGDNPAEVLTYEKLKKITIIIE